MGVHLTGVPLRVFCLFCSGSQCAKDETWDGTSFSTAEPFKACFCRLSCRGIVRDVNYLSTKKCYRYETDGVRACRGNLGMHEVRQAK